ncbi:MAG: ABC transporter ATP-binding protein [Candidatus Margulisiibacteriota bacterium]
MIKLKARKKLMTANGLLDFDVDLNIEPGEFVTLFGRSGCGKTTILRMLAGLTPPDEGFISVNGRVWFDSSGKINLAARKRAVGFVFQEHSLFPNMTVRQNLEFALEDKKDESRVDELLEMAHITELADRRPGQLSGGQRQRAALIRALLRKAEVYLLDEPLASLDQNMRLKLQDEIIRLYRDNGVSTVFVSHDLAEVYKMTGRVCVIEDGKIIKNGTPAEIFTDGRLSGKFNFPGEIVEIKKDQGANILTVLVGNNPVKVVALDEEIKGLSIGSKIIVASKAFNPVIMRIS